MARFHHFGVPTSIVHENETYLDGAKVYITDPDAHPYRIEFLRFDADSPMPKSVMAQAHAAFIVDDLDAAIAGQNVIIEPFEPVEHLRCAFIQDGDAVLELMQEI